MGNKPKPRRKPPAQVSSSTAIHRFKETDWLASLGLVMATVLCYYRVINAGFIWDDDQHLTQNPCIIGPLGFAQIWTTTQAYYYPLVLTTFWILHRLVDLNPAPYHAVNLVMHAASGLMLWRVLRQLGVRWPWLGAVLWTVHPVMVESVAWVTELKNTQSCFFYLLSINLFLRVGQTQADAGKARATTNQLVFAFSILAFAMALTSKSSTVMLPLVLRLCLWWKRQPLTVRQLSRLAPYVLLSAAAGLWTIWEQRFHSGAGGADWSQSPIKRLLIAGDAFWFYLGKLLWPDPLVFIYPRWTIDPSSALTFLPLLSLVGGLAGLWMWRNTGARPVFFAAFYFLLSLFPILGLFNVYYFRYSFVSDHFQYLAAMGPLALAAAALGEINRRTEQKRRAAVSAAAAVLVVILGVLSWQRTGSYVDAETLYKTTIEQNPGCWLAYTNLGGLYLQRHRLSDAIESYQKAVAINPKAPEAQYSLGNAFFASGRLGEAIPRYEAALRSEPTHTRARLNLGIALAGSDRVNDALREFETAVELAPKAADAQYNLGYTLAQLGHRDEAIQHLQTALRLQPNYAQAQEQLRILGAADH